LTSEATAFLPFLQERKLPNPQPDRSDALTGLRLTSGSRVNLKELVSFPET
jgi:hypothetical protein